MKKPSKVFKSIRFAKLDPNHDKGPKGSLDDEEHYTVSSQEYQQQVDHVKKRAMQEEKKDKYDEGEYDREGDMAKSDLRSIIANAKRLHDMIEDSTNLPEWVQSKITKSEDYISTVANYMTSEMNEQHIEEAAKKIKMNFKMPPESIQDKLYRQHQEIRKKRGAPDPEEYKKMGDQKQKEIEAMKEEVKDEYARKVDKYLKKKYGKDKQPQGADFAAQRRKERLAKNERMDEDVSKMSTEKLKKHWDTHKDQTGASPVFATQLKKVSNELAKRKALNKEEVELAEGRPSQRHPLEGHEYHKKTDAELEYIAKDAHKAAEAMKSHNPTAENKYRDQANDSATVRYFRKKSGTPDWYKKKYGHMKEDVESLDEISKELKTSYRQKAIGDIRALRPHAEKGEYTDLAKNVMKKRMDGVNRSVKESSFDQYTEKVEPPTGELKDTCWKGYTAVGLKNKNGKKVPNCVPESVEIQESRKAQIVREAVKKAKEKNKNKNDDKFEPEPELNSQVHKIDNV